MEYNESEKHFAEICDCLWQKRFYLMESDPPKAAAMYYAVAYMVMLAWNICLVKPTYAEIQDELRKLAELFNAEKLVLTVFRDAAELKWREFRMDKEPVSGVKISVVDGKFHAEAHFEDSLLPDALITILEFMSTSELKERLLKVNADQKAIEEKLRKLADDFNASHKTPGDDDGQDNKNNGQKD